MRKLFLTVLLSLSTILGLQAQLYGNEWINLDQTYFRLTVLHSGIYRLEYNDLINAGIRVDTIDPQTLQIWRRGEEHAIKVEGEGDGVFNTTDFLEFYGERNDGWQDEKLYTNNNHLNPDYSLYADSSAYFITWGDPGKRMEQLDVNASGIAPEPYYYREDVFQYEEDYSLGQVLVSVSYNSYWDKGEGWMSNVFQFNPAKPSTNNFKRVNFTGLDDVNTSGEASLEYLLCGRNNQTHVAEVKVDNTVYNTHTYQQYEKLKDKVSFNVNDVVDGKIEARVSALSNGVVNDAQSIVSLKLRYPRNFNMKNRDSLYYHLRTNLLDTSYVEVSNFPIDAKVFDITDAANIREIQTSTSTTLNFYVNGTKEEKTIYINKNGHFHKPFNIRKADFNDDLAGDPNYLIVTHPTLKSGSMEYAAYRESIQGGSHKALVAIIHRLYDQYSYGEVNPLAIRRFARYLHDYGSPEYLLLMGKSVTVDFQVSNRPYYRHVDPKALRADGVLLVYGTKDLVPTFGVPASDLNFTSTFLPQSYLPAIATGRIPVRDNQGVIDYLNKVKEHEALGYDALWRKNIVHLGGGIGTEALQFKSFLDGFKAIAEGPLLGGKVTTFSKSGAENIEFFNISEQVNKGLNLITFFGHSSPSISDIDIGNVSDVINGYENKGKYPMLIINGCKSGNAYTTTSQGEDWIMTPDKGAINFLGHSDQGYALQLRNYSSNFYTTLYGEDSLYGGPVGKVQRRTIEKFLGSTIVDFAKITQVQQFNLQGDPANVLFSPDLPDYYVDSDRITFHSFDENPITAVSDSFRLQVVIDNYGRAINDTLRICVQRTYNSGATIEQLGPFKFYPAPYYQDTLSITIRSKDNSTFGQNIFTVSLDCVDSIQELTKLNNVATTQLFVPSSGVITLYPKEFSIVGNSTINFVAQSTDLLISENTQYVFQLDTNDSFSMPLLNLETTARAFPSWQNINLPAIKDSLVYYWRVRYKNIPVGQDTLWAEASFMYIPGQEGWAQAHFPQFRKTTPTNVLKDYDNRVWLYDTVTSFIQATAGGGNVTDESGGSLGHRVTSIKVGDQALMVAGGVNRCSLDGIVALSFSQTTALPYHPTGSDIEYCGLSPRIVQDWNNNQLSGFASYVGDVPEGDYILFMAYRETNYSIWNAAAKDSLKALGAQLVDVLQNEDPYILFVRKGNPVPIFESTGSPTDTLRFNYTLKGQYDRGNITSPLIGPASDWGSLYQQYKDSGEDEFKINVYGVGLNNSKTFITSFAGNNYDSLDLKNEVFIDPVLYPYIQLEAVTKDSTDLSIPQLKKWFVVYTGVPEGIMEPGIIGLDKYVKKPVYEGDSISFSYAFVNISDKDFSDRLVVRYTVTNQSTGKHVIHEDSLKTLAAGDTIIFNVKLPTFGLGKENSLHAYVNPKYLPEEYYNNNVLVTTFQVNKDNQHPILDVTFDGKRILNGEIVSPTPVINIAMQDENPYLLKGDTAGINIFLRRPCTNPDPLFGCEYERILLSNSDLITVYPATNPKDFRIEYRPERLPDGVYELLVQVADVAGNKSGNNAYSIQFEVINKSSITNVLPYPNPFSTSVRFVFTLTGSVVPEDMKIQIMTITGKVVREIMKEELGVIRIGNNISEYAWDGRDEFGDELANGTYLYRVIIKDDGVNYEHRETKADQAFKRGFGKMVKIK